FLGTLGELCGPGGLLFLSTLNRSARAFFAAKLGAEYLFRWLPVGTHDWRRFVTPQEMASARRGSGFRLGDIAGLSFDPLTGGWRIGRYFAVNYLAMAEQMA